MGSDHVRTAYAERALEYATLLGHVEDLAPQDRDHLEGWAARVDGPILDLGCGPGHWTAHLADRGHEVRGIDPVPAFVAIARARRPDVDVRLGGVDDLPGVSGPDGGYGGILAWYSLIHLDPAALPGALAAIRGALRPGGRLLLGLFDGGDATGPEPFDHAVVTAYRWPAPVVVDLLRAARLEPVNVVRRTDPGSRPHLAIEAVAGPGGEGASPRPMPAHGGSGPTLRR